MPDENGNPTKAEMAAAKAKGIAQARADLRRAAAPQRQNKTAQRMQKLQDKEDRKAAKKGKK